MKNKAVYTIISVVCFYTIFSCTSSSNYNLIFDYLKKTKNGISTFKGNCECTPDRDSIIVNEKFIVDKDKFRYSVEFCENVISIEFSPEKITVLKDSNGLVSLFDTTKYSMKTADAFSQPNFQVVHGVYYQHSRNDSTGINIKSCEIDWDYKYRLYFSKDGEDLVLHKDFWFKKELNWSFYFSPNFGLYKIIENLCGECLWKK
jgi:hypothetical protein